MGGVFPRTCRLLILIATISVAAPVLAAAQAGPAASGHARTPWLYLGTRLGAEYQLESPGDFNDSIQKLSPGNQSYFPVYSRIGISIIERVPIGNTGSSFTLNQLAEVSGLDQNFVLPSGTLLVGIHLPSGLEAALGPRIEPFAESGGVKTVPSLVYSIGWRFKIGRSSLPVDVMVDPLPPGRHLRLALVTGIDYGFAPHRSKPSQPFNY